jgi:hypothetical protein
MDYESGSMNSLYVLAGAVGGAIVKMIFTGHYTMRAFFIGVASIILGSAVTILIIHFVPTLGNEPIVVSSLSSIVTAVSSGVFRRIHAAHLRAKMFGFEAESEGDENER